MIIFFCLLKTYSQQPDPLLSKDFLDQKKWVDSIYNSITLKEKIGQLFVPMVFSNRDSFHLKNTLDLVKRNQIGGVIFSKAALRLKLSGVIFSSLSQKYHY